MTRSDHVVPFAVEALRVEIDVAHVSLRHRATGRILPPIQPTSHRVGLELPILALSPGLSNVARRQTFDLR